MNRDLLTITHNNNSVILEPFDRDKEITISIIQGGDNTSFYVSPNEVNNIISFLVQQLNDINYHTEFDRFEKVFSENEKRRKRIDQLIIELGEKDIDITAFSEWLIKNATLSTDNKYCVYNGENFFSTRELYQKYLEIEHPPLSNPIVNLMSHFK